MFQVTVDVSSFPMVDKTNITGKIWIELDQHPFPSTEWYDFPVVILSWWAEELLKLKEGMTAEAVCDFMDGPFQWNVKPLSDDEWLLLLKERKRDGVSIIHQGLTCSKEVFDQVLVASQRIHAACLENSWITEDVSRLAEWIARLRTRPR